MVAVRWSGREEVRLQCPSAGTFHCLRDLGAAWRWMWLTARDPANCDASRQTEWEDVPPVAVAVPPSPDLPTSRSAGRATRGLGICPDHTHVGRCRTGTLWRRHHHCHRPRQRDCLRSQDKLPFLPLARLVAVALLAVVAVALPPLAIGGARLDTRVACIRWGHASTC
jgi:hypothetical protein